MLDKNTLEALGDKIWRAYDMLDTYEALNTDNISEYTNKQQLLDTFEDLEIALTALLEAREILVTNLEIGA